jgi:ATP-dependent exoDNAse (exonuclease V) beta subunit
MSLVRSKGLEFEDCALVNVFGTASLSKALQDAWLQLFDLMASEETLAALVSKKKLQEQAAMLRLPRIFERELKQLYVALTRARSKLFVVEVLPDEYAKRSHLVMGVVRALERMRLANVSAILPRAMVRFHRFTISHIF